MELLTPEILEEFKRLGKQEIGPDTIVVCKYFHPAMQPTWYATEYDPGREKFFGYVDSEFGEWGPFTLAQLKSLDTFGMEIDRDLGFKTCKFSELELRF